MTGFTPAGNDEPATCTSLLSDAGQWAQNFCRDFRALHQFNHDHDCTSTCIKYVKKGKDIAEDALRKGWTVACRFFYYHVVVFTYMCNLAGKVVTKRIRRRGKKLVDEAYIATTNQHGELFKAIVRRDTPFRSATSDVAQSWGRCNIDFQFMPRALDPDQFLGDNTAQPAAPDIDPNLALAMYGVRLRLPSAPLLRRCFHAIAAMFQAAHNCDYYIAKYQGKPMEQLQSLLANIATGLHRLEEEDEAATSTEANASASLVAERARKATLRIASAANRSSWCSSCELASFVQTGGQCRKTHLPVQVFLSRPLYLFEECRRLMQQSHKQLIECGSGAATACILRKDTTDD